MTREKKFNLLNELLEYEEKNDIGNLTRADRREFQQWVNEALEQEPTTKNDLAQERYQDLIEYFGDEKVAKTILKSRKEFKAWLERLRWNTKKVDELARELEQIRGTAKNDLTEQCIACNYNETEEENGEHCKKCLEGDSQFELDVDCVSRQAAIEALQGRK